MFFDNRLGMTVRLQNLCKRFEPVSLFMSTHSKEKENEIAVALLARIAKEETKAMEEFYRTFSRVVYAFVLRRLENTVEAEEVVVETMYEIWRNAGSFGGRSAPRTWLLGIAHHKMLDKLRARGARLSNLSTRKSWKTSCRKNPARLNGSCSCRLGNRSLNA
ncbi:MAG: hypothetical protein HYS18_03005 [Burkholderiales bacterium]|nr:hypothetical protein [Burkholderiales bacterium]